MNSHESKNTSTSHLNKFYLHFQDVKENKYDGMIVTGAPVENMEFEEVDYWKEITEIMDWSETHVTSTIFFCAGRHRHLSIILRSEEKTASAENVRSVLASRAEPQDPAGAWL